MLYKLALTSLAALASSPLGASQQTVITAGVADGYAPPTEPTDPDAHLSSVLPPPARTDFDEFPTVLPSGQVNSLVVHRFKNLPGNIGAATLEFRVRGIPGADAQSDTIALFFDDGSFTGGVGCPGYFEASWERYLGAFTSCPQLEEGLLKPNQLWTGADDMTFTLDLSALPLNPFAGGGVASVIMEMNQYGFLDVVVADESTVDYMILTITTGRLSYCTAGTSASGCQAALSASGTASATAPSGFTFSATTVEGQKDGLFFFGSNGQQANLWGNGTSYQCVVPPVKRCGLLTGTGTVGACDGSLSQDLNALWCSTCSKPGHNPGAGSVVQVQLWYRDPLSTSNQTTSLSDAVEFGVGP